MINNRQIEILQFAAQENSKALSTFFTPKYRLPILFIVLHIPLGILLYNSSFLALIHPLIVIVYGLYWATRTANLEKVAHTVAYLIGVEVLWRMADSPIFWEFGKYGAATLMLVALIRRGYTRIPALPLLYIILLIPGCVLTILNTNNLSVARGLVSSNISGPFLLMVSCWFFSYLKINWIQLKKLLFIVSIPLISVALATVFFTVTAEDIKFTGESNFQTSGGFGPNQVSTMLGLGVFLCLSCFTLFKNNFKEKIYLLICSTLFAAQSVMTFSRSGISNAIGAFLILLLTQKQNFSTNFKNIISIVGIVAIFIFFLFPYLNNFTEDALQTRFEELNTTNRTIILQADFQIFLDNPIFGTGVGVARYSREELLGKVVASHTEFSRLLAEHGIFGIFAIILLLVGVIYNVKRQKSRMGKAIIIGSIIWSSLYMLNSGMRLAAPSIMWGLSFLTIVELRSGNTSLLQFFRNRVRKA